MTFVLASGSPRRRELLEQAGFRFRVVKPRVDESPPGPMSPLAEARRAARLKAEEIAKSFPGELVVAADTVVAVKGKSLGKPRDAKHARQMLRLLSGQTHLVYTAVHVIDSRRNRSVDGFSRTFVTMRRLPLPELERYARSMEAQDKAGAYAIQGEGARLVRAIRGPRDNVIGMPVALLRRLLAELARQP